MLGMRIGEWNIAVLIEHDLHSLSVSIGCELAAECIGVLTGLTQDQLCSVPDCSGQVGG